MSENFNTRKTLIQNIKDQHDTKSWEDFVFYYNRYIYAIISNMNMRHHDAEDIVQRVLLKLWKKLPEFEFIDKGDTSKLLYAAGKFFITGCCFLDISLSLNRVFYCYLDLCH